MTTLGPSSVSSDGRFTESFDVDAVKAEFPVLSVLVHGKPLYYLDNAATTQKPRIVIDTLRTYYGEYNANIHRAVHTLSEKATERYEAGRGKVRAFLNAASVKEIIFTRNATEGINLVAQTYGRKNLKPEDEILITAMEHHANIVPWQMLCEQTGAVLKVVPISDEGELDFEAFTQLLSTRTKFVSVSHMSNALGTVNPIEKMIELAHSYGAPILIDAAQSAYHKKLDVQALDCDFLVFSGHKLYGPTGIGVLYGKEEILRTMPPYQGGGDMILSVTFEKTIYNDLPYKFEAGTPHIAGVIGLGAAIDFLNDLGLERVERYETELLAYGTEALKAVPGLTIIGTAPIKASILSFVMDGVHPHDVGTLLDQYGVAVRTGHHCAQPVMDRFCIPATTRASLACYNTKADIDALVFGLKKVAEVFG